jgi:Zn-dependent peptidase ImmA (M78 family)
MTSRVNINPSVLKWARINAGYNDSNLPKNILKNYKKWESGDLKPTWNQLRDLANQYKRPSAFFFRSTIPKFKETHLMEYRGKDHIYPKTPQLIYNIRKYKNLREIYIELLETMHLEKKSFEKYKFDSKNSREFAFKIREIVGVDLSLQKEWILDNNRNHDFKHYKFLNEWKNALNTLGILIFESERVSLDEMKGLTLYYDEYPIIILNGLDNVNSRIFSLFHELTHLMLGESAICDLEETNRKEIFCNAVAGEFLVPSSDLIEKKVLNNEDTILEDDEISKLSNEYGVSKEVILRRFLTLKKINKSIYQSKTSEWSKEYQKPSGGGGNFLNNKLKYFGKMYSRLVLSAYENSIISSLDFSEYMDMKIKHASELENKIFGD